MTFSKQWMASRSLGDRAFCFVSPACFAGSSLTYAKRPIAQTLSEVFDV